MKSDVTASNVNEKTNDVVKRHIRAELYVTFFHQRSTTHFLLSFHIKAFCARSIVFHCKHACKYEEIKQAGDLKAELPQFPFAKT